jgi:CTP:phosphocholine cytidylyltransferase-like protein
MIIIPIGGIGQRFKAHGYKNPKALINIYGKPILSFDGVVFPEKRGTSFVGEL